MEPYLYFSGLLSLAEEIKGDETIHMGIRPYGFHAGNALALIVYPFLLCKNLKELGKEPRLNFIVSINDWEQDALDGPNPREYPFNIFPKNTSIHFLPDERGCCRSAVDHWQPIIEKNILSLRSVYPGITFRFVRNSELINHQFCRSLLKETIQKPEDQFEILRSNSDKKTLETPIKYAGAICPKCKRAHGETGVVKNDIISWKCDECGYAKEDSIENFQYWWYHKPMLLARMQIFDIDITLSGGDHFSEGDFNIRKTFIKKYSPKTKEPKMLFTPTAIALDGQKMSKSRFNTEFANLPNLLLAADGFLGDELVLTEDLIAKNIDEKNYSYIL